MWAVQFAEEALDGHDVVTSRAIGGHDPTTRAPLLLDFCHPIFIGLSTSAHMSLDHSSIAKFNRHLRISLMRSTIEHLTRAYDLDQVG